MEEEEYKGEEALFEKMLQDLAWHVQIEKSKEASFGGFAALIQKDEVILDPITDSSVVGYTLPSTVDSTVVGRVLAKERIEHLTYRRLARNFLNLQFKSPSLISKILFLPLGANSIFGVSWESRFLLRVLRIGLKTFKLNMEDDLHNVQQALEGLEQQLSCLVKGLKDLKREEEAILEQISRRNLG
ncbi:hypothetical protein M9H77_07317 [Catharanthus roseus]|uniref:Uncharacterized protein n=1 Tax=Catharanthus roseus TaxID=4058 RepID=A0ACC0BUU2_CATRO|nr:hypothetical protein M9H77_07317 [Catharanthus roseus]